MTGSGSEGEGGRAGSEERGGGLPIRDGWEAWGARGLWTARAEGAQEASGGPGSTAPADGSPDEGEDPRTGAPPAAPTAPAVPRTAAPDPKALPSAWSVGREHEGEGENFGAGRLVRLYTLTGGRTRARAELPDLDLIAQITATERALALVDPADLAGTGQSADTGPAHTPEHERLLDLVRRQPLSVAELAAECDLPVGVVRILLGDLLAAELVRVDRPVGRDRMPDERLLREVINGLRAL